MTLATGMPISSLKKNPTTWAERLAEPQGEGAHTTRPHLAAIATLWTLFGDALTQANAALEQADLSQRITVQECLGERRYRMTGRDGDESAISVFLSLPVLDGDLFGGAFIRTVRLREPIYLVPATVGGRIRWTVVATGSEFTPTVVRDVFLSAFRGDRAANNRLAPLAGYDLFQTPWS